MPLDEGHVESTAANTGRPVVWTAVALVGSVLVASFSIPWETPGSIYDHVQRSDLLHPEWLVAGTLLALPVFYAARASWVAGLIAIVLPGAQMLYIADTAAEEAAHFDLAGRADALWYGVAIAQVTLFAVTGILGAYRGIEERRWMRYMAELTSDRSSDIPWTGPD